MNILFLMDPLETVSFDKDTSLAIMWGAQKRGHHIFYLANGGLSLTEHGVRFRVTEIETTHDRDHVFQKKDHFLFCEDDVDVIFIRTDPPFNEDYLMNTWILDRLAPRILVMNSARGIRQANEKLWALQFTDLVPPTLVSQDKSELLDFLKIHPDAIAKPTDSYGGQMIFRVSDDDSNRNVILETVSRNFSRKMILQKYIPQATTGDKRVLLLNGDILGAVLRMHSPEDHRNNFFAGGSALGTELTVRDREIIERLKPALRGLGLHLVGIDILGDFLIEVNVTSPTCLQEMNRIYHQELELDIIRYAESLCPRHSTT